MGFKPSYGSLIQSGSGNPHGRHLGSGSDRDRDRDRDADAFVLGIIIGSNGLSGNNSGKRTLILWRIEAKLDLLLKQANLSFDPYQSLPAGVVEALQRGEKIRAINSTARPPAQA